MENMKEIICNDGSIRRTGDIGPENVVEKVIVFLGMEHGRYDGREWGYIFGKNLDGSCAILVPMNPSKENPVFREDNESFAEIYTRCEWNDHFDCYYAGGDCVQIEDGAISWCSKKD